MEMILTLVIILLISLWFVLIRTKRRNLPPGPRGVPILGSILDLGDKPHQYFTTLAQTYGPLLSLKLGQITVVVITSNSLAKEALQTRDLSFSDRADIDSVKAVNHHEDGLPWLPICDKWRNLRKACNNYLFSHQKLDQNIQLRRSKVQELLEQVRECSREGKAVDIGRAVFETSLNSMSNTLLSLNLRDTKSEITRDFKAVVTTLLDQAGVVNVGDCFPFLRKLDLQGIRRRTAVFYEKILSLMDRLIEERLEARKSEGYVGRNDMLDSLLGLSEEHKDEMDIHRIKHLFLDLFVGGTDTTAITSEWAMAELLRNPDTLRKAKAELKEKIGEGKLVEESEVAQLPYLHAVIKETLRLHPPVPLLVPRKVREEAKLGGYTIPKDAQLFVNAYAIARDPSLWEDPLSFVPERFLTCDIDIRGKNFELIPFGAGRRNCAGMPLAMRMLHLLVGSLINSFDWKLENGASPESLNMEEHFNFSVKKAQPLRAIPLQV